MPGGPSQEFITTIPENVMSSLRQRGYSFINCYGEPAEQPHSDIGLVREGKLVGFLLYRVDGLNLAWKLFTREETNLIDDITAALSESSQHLRKIMRQNPSTLLQTRN